MSTTAAGESTTAADESTAAADGSATAAAGITAAAVWEHHISLWEYLFVPQRRSCVPRWRDNFNLFGPEFTIVIFIHYKPRIRNSRLVVDEDDLKRVTN